MQKATEEKALLRQRRLSGWYEEIDVQGMFNQLLEDPDKLEEPSRSALILLDHTDQTGRRIATLLNRDLSKGTSLCLGPRDGIANIVRQFLGAPAMIGTAAAWADAQLPIVVVGHECGVAFDFTSPNGASHWFFPGLDAAPS